MDTCNLISLGITFIFIIVYVFIFNVQKHEIKSLNSTINSLKINLESIKTYQDIINLKKIEQYALKMEKNAKLDTEIFIKEYTQKTKEQFDKIIDDYVETIKFIAILSYLNPDKLSIKTLKQFLPKSIDYIIQYLPVYNGNNNT